jgi:hypothetical protein
MTTIFPNRRSAGGYDFAVDPDLRGDRAAAIWLPRLDPTVVLVAPAPALISDAANVSALAQTFRRSVSDGDYLLIEDAGKRLPVVLTNGANIATPAAVVIPLDAHFAARMDAALRLWQLTTGGLRYRPPNRLSPQRRQRLTQALRALDGRLAGESYRSIAQGLFGAARVPIGSGWKTHDLRDRTIRLVRTGMYLMQGGYMDLLRSPHDRRE